MYCVYCGLCMDFGGNHHLSVVDFVERDNVRML